MSDQPTRRMVLWRELKWLFAAYIIWLMFRLVEREASAQTVMDFVRLGANMNNDPKFDVVRIRYRTKI